MAVGELDRGTCHRLLLGSIVTFQVLGRVTWAPRSCKNMFQKLTICSNLGDRSGHIQLPPT